MILAKVVGRVWSDRQVDQLEAVRLLACRSIDDERLLVAVDLVQAATGSTVLVVCDEVASRAANGAATDAAIVALVAGTDPLGE